MKYLKLKNKIKKLKDEKDSLSWSRFKLGRENERLREKNERLEKLNKDLVQEKAFLNLELEKKLKEPKEIINANVTAEDLAKEIARALNKSDEKEHKCTSECFEKHVIKAIQNDYDSCSKEVKLYFLMYWYDNLLSCYPWLEKLYIIDEKIYFKSKESSI